MAASADVPDLHRIIEVLARHHVECLFVGGIAARAYGAQRLTFDVDCLAQRDADNLDRLATAMRELNARLRVEGLSDEAAAGLPVQLNGSMLAQLEISTWRTDAGDLDILADMPDRSGRHLRYEELISRAAEFDLDGVILRVAALDDVIASKEWADRPKDRDALGELRALQQRGQLGRPKPPGVGGQGGLDR